MKTRPKLLALGALIALVLSLTAIFAFGTAAESTPTLDIGYCNLSFRDSVVIKYAVYTENVASPSANVKLLVWTEPQSEYILGTQDSTLTTVGTQTISGKEHIVFDYDKLTAKQMTDVIYTRAYAEIDGEVYYSGVNKYSILQYAYNKLGKTDDASTNAALIQMLTDMLKYGASAQKYFEYKLDSLATDEYYQVKVEGGTLTDKCDHGLYLSGSTVDITAPEVNADGVPFFCWADDTGALVSKSNVTQITVGQSNRTYTPYYSHETYSWGFEYGYYSDDTETCYVSGIGTCTDTEIIIPSVSPTGRKVIAIHSSAFKNCSDITRVIIPDGVGYIQSNAFEGCSQLTEIVIPDSIKTIQKDVFAGCYSLVYSQYENGFYLGNSQNPYFALIKASTDDAGTFKAHSDTKLIGYGVFENNSDLRSVSLPNGLLFIDPYVFAGCTKLSSVTIPDSVTELDYSAFEGCTSLKSVTLSAGMKKVNVNTFEGCTSLKSIVIPDGITSISGEAFYGCTSLESIVLPSSVKNIFSQAFERCPSFTYIFYEGTLEEYEEIRTWSYNSTFNSLSPYIYSESAPTVEGNYWHYDENGIPEVWPPHVHDDGEWVVVTPATVDSNGLRKKVCTDCGETICEEIIPVLASTGLEFTSNGDGTCYVSGMGDCTDTEIIIPPVSLDNDRVTAIGAKAFADQTGITSVTVPSGVTSIGNSAFNFCSSLSDVSLPDGLISIGDYAFYRCKFASIFLPDSLTSIGYGTFRGCVNLESISIPGGVTIIEGSTFEECSSLRTVYYGNASGWNDITIGMYNDGLNNSTVYYYSESAPTVEGNFWHYDENGVPTVWPPHKHDDGEWVVVTPATVESNGLRKKVCTGCGAALSEEIIPALVASSGLEFSYIESTDSYSVIGIGDCKDSDLIIPSTHEGKPVQYIAGEAFMGCTTIKSVYIPGSVKVVGNKSFYYTTLTSVYMAEGVEMVGKNAFNSNYGTIKLMVIPSTLKTIEAEAFMCGAKCVIINSESVAQKALTYDSIGYLLFHAQSVMIKDGISYGSYVHSGRSYQTAVTFNGVEYTLFCKSDVHSCNEFSIPGFTGYKCDYCYAPSDDPIT